MEGNSPAGSREEFGIGAEVAVGQRAIISNLAAEVIQGLKPKTKKTITEQRKTWRKPQAKSGVKEKAEAFGKSLSKGGAAPETLQLQSRPSWTDVGLGHSAALQCHSWYWPPGNPQACFATVALIKNIL